MSGNDGTPTRNLFPGLSDQLLRFRVIFLGIFGSVVCGSLF